MWTQLVMCLVKLVRFFKGYGDTSIRGVYDYTKGF